MHEMDVHTLPPFERCQVDGFFAFWSAGLVGGKKVNLLVFLSKKYCVWKLLVYKFYMIYKNTTSSIL